jgi:16S rRNA (uracil1498-N3)-methyltransferase
VSRFYVPKDSVGEKTIVIGGEEAHHIIDVMRLKPSDFIKAFDGSGREYVGIIAAVKNKSVIVNIVRTIEPPSSAGVKITLIQAVPKKAKMDYIVEKATELGVSSLIPVFTGRTIPDWDEKKKASSVDRWRKIALESSKQCGRSEIPSIAELTDFSELLKKARVFDLALIATLIDGAVTLKTAVKGFTGKEIAVAIGPEGDFTPEEVALSRDAGFRAVTLGPRVLKSDTAGLAVLAILEYELTG